MSNSQLMGRAVELHPGAWLGIDVPGQASLIAFDDYPWMSARKTPLTAVRQPVDKIARAAWERLRMRMDGDLSGPRSTVLHASLQDRATVRRIGPPAQGRSRRAAGARAGRAATLDTT